MTTRTVYFDARTRFELEHLDEAGELGRDPAQSSAPAETAGATILRRGCVHDLEVVAVGIEHERGVVAAW